MFKKNLFSVSVSLYYNETIVAGELCIYRLTGVCISLGSVRVGVSSHGYGWVLERGWRPTGIREGSPSAKAWIGLVLAAAVVGLSMENRKVRISAFFVYLPSIKGTGFAEAACFAVTVFQ